MTNAPLGTLVLKDAAGSYFLVSQETLEQVRVPRERTPEIERLIADAAADDVHGQLVAAAFLVGVAIGYGGTKAARGDRLMPAIMDGVNAGIVRGLSELR